MALHPSYSGNLKQLALKGLMVCNQQQQQPSRAKRPVADKHCTVLELPISDREAPDTRSQSEGHAD